MALLRVPGFITTSVPSSGGGKADTIFSNEASAIINSIPSDATPSEILSAKKTILELGTKFGARPDVVDKQVSRLIQPLLSAQKRQTLWDNLNNARTAIDYTIGQEPDLLKSPQDYVITKVRMLDRLQTQLQSNLDEFEKSGDINSASKVQSQIDKIKNSEKEYLNALQYNRKGEKSSLILVADVNPYNGQIYNGKYITPEEYNRDYQSQYLLLDKAITDTNTKIAVSKNNLRNNEFIYNGVKWMLPKNIGIGGINFTGGAAGSGVGNLLLQSSGANVLEPSLLPEGVSNVTFKVNLQPDVATGIPYIGTDNNSIYIRKNPNGKVVKFNIPNAQQYMESTSQPFLRVHTKDQLREIESQIGKTIDIPQGSTSTISSFVPTPSQQVPLQPVNNIPGARTYRGKTGAPQQPRSNIWRTAGRIFGETILGPISAGINIRNLLNKR